MKFSTKTTYGLRAMIYLAKEYGKNPVPLPTIAEKERLSLGYLERIFSALKKSELITAVKGTAGGYSLAKAPSLISIFEIISATEDGLEIFYCLDEKGKVYCSQKCGCKVNSVLQKVQTAVNQTLQKIKLSELSN